MAQDEEDSYIICKFAEEYTEINFNKTEYLAAGIIKIKIWK